MTEFFSRKTLGLAFFEEKFWTCFFRGKLLVVSFSNKKFEMKNFWKKTIRNLGFEILGKKFEIFWKKFFPSQQKEKKLCDFFFNFCIQKMFFDIFLPISGIFSNEKKRWRPYDPRLPKGDWRRLSCCRATATRPPSAQQVISKFANTQTGFFSVVCLTCIYVTNICVL